MIYLAFAVIFLHLISAGMVFRVDAGADTDIRRATFGIKLFGVPLFRKKIVLPALDRLSDVAENTQSEKKEKKSANGKLKKFAVRFGLELIKRVRVRDGNLSGTMGVGDAAATAIVLGSARTAIGSGGAVIGLDVSDKVRISPEYERAVICMDFFCIFSLCIADIMYAAFCALAHSR